MSGYIYELLIDIVTDQLTTMNLTKPKNLHYLIRGIVHLGIAVDKKEHPDPERHLVNMDIAQQLLNRNSHYDDTYWFMKDDMIYVKDSNGIIGKICIEWGYPYDYSPCYHYLPHLTLEKNPDHPHWQTVGEGK